MYLQNLNRSPFVFKRLNSFILGPRSSSNTRSSQAFFTWSDIVNLNAVNPLLSIYEGKMIIFFNCSSPMRRRLSWWNWSKWFHWELIVTWNEVTKLWLVRYYNTISVVQSCFITTQSHVSAPCLRLRLWRELSCLSVVKAGFSFWQHSDVFKWAKNCKNKVFNAIFLFSISLVHLKICCVVTYIRPRTHLQHAFKIHQWQSSFKTTSTTSTCWALSEFVHDRAKILFAQ